MAQGEHEVAPTDEYVPSGHLLHCEAPVPENVPAGHVRHLPDPLSGI